VNGGSVGIGTTSPSYALDVNGTGNFSGDLYASGNVGIGTTSPDALLDVRGATIINNQGFATRGYEKLSVQGSGVAVSVRDGSKFIYLSAEDGNTFKLDAFDDSTSSGVDIEIAGNGGNVGIGTTSPSYKLDVAGTITANDDIYWNQGSDPRMKNNLRSINATEKLDTLGGYLFEWYEDHTKAGETWMGLRADEMKDAFPHMVSKRDDGMLGIDSPSQMHGFHVAVAKEQQSRIEELEAEVARLKSKVN
jgi:hypothetical protein